MKAFVSNDFAYIGNKVGNEQDYVWVYLGSPTSTPWLQFFPMVLRAGHWATGRWTTPASINPQWADVSVNTPHVANVLHPTPSIRLSKGMSEVYLADSYYSETGPNYDANISNKHQSVFVSQIIAANGWKPLPILNAFGSTGAR